MSFQVKSISELDQLVRKWVTQLPERSIVLLRGPMAAGKTQWVTSVVRALGGQGVSSPTFALHQEYVCGEKHVHHFDLYRLESEDEITTSGFWDLLMGPPAWIFVEWPERLGQVRWPAGWAVVDVQIELTSSNERKITITENKN